MKKYFWIILAIIVVAVGVGLYFILREKKSANYEWRTAKIDRGDIKMVVTATGTLSADTTVQVGTQVSGVVSKIFVDFNSVVRKGQVIAVIDTTFLAASVTDARASLNKAQVQVDLTKRTFDRTKALFDEKVMAQADYDQAYSDYQTARANYISVKAALDRALINLRYATIVAPVSGVVVSRAVDVGQTVAASFSTPTLFSIANDLTKMQVQASIDEADIGKIQVGQDVSFTVNAYQDMIFNGKVRQIRLSPTVSQNVVNYTVIIDVPNPDKKLLPGMTANITVKIQEVDSVVRVPASALRFTPPQDYIQKMMNEWPDSIKQKIAFWKQGGNRQGGNRTESGLGSPSRNGSNVPRNFASQGRQGMQGRQQGMRGRDTGFARPADNNSKDGQPRKREFGILWIKQGNILIPYRVHVGLSDGSYTEIMGHIKEGEEVVMGMVNTGQSTTTQTQQRQQQSPFMPGPPPGGRGGR
ncbi:MAG: efflux RND transporter periplasmic adaptor subunit [Bacteroidota bacterium]|nr:efflux RND transporter periplasmic adaptor subunit [Bacteroidota bacterium]